MKKVIKIEGMSCNHCKARVEKALQKLEGVQATVDLTKGEAAVTSENEVADEVLKKAVTDSGYTVLSVQKG